MNGFRFRTQARTIDHLGQNQIADCPTAISELWKNAYDAYARDVALHVFEGERPMAAIVDNGHGMSPTEFVEKWLVVGTESKASSKETPEEDRFGLPPRVAQGQKGIGRLSVAYLGPLVLVLSKRTSHDFVAALIDWRVFENPYLLLDDVVIPVETFANTKDFHSVFDRMRTLLSENVWPLPDGEERGERLSRSWQRYDEDLQRSGKGKLSDDIAGSVIAFDVLNEEKLNVWSVWSGNSPCGTALFVLDVNRELSVWVDPSAPAEDDEVRDAKGLLVDTLVSFVDPYLEESRENFRYEVVTHAGGRSKREIRWEDTVSSDEVRELEHVVEGEIDEFGVFTGTIRAFGKDLGTVVLPPQRHMSSSSRAYVGRYRILTATYEQDIKRTSMTPERYAWWEERIARYGGFAIYRDWLRVLPYGRVGGDFFGIEERRSKHAGRYFWSYRRIVGRIALSRDGNPNLVDKAGREGLKDNQARREFRIRVVDLLNTVAKRYFGTDSPERAEKIMENEQRHRDELRKANKRSLRELRAELAAKEPALQASLVDVVETLTLLEQARGGRIDVLRDFEERVNSLRRRKIDLGITQLPRNLDDEDEERYRTYRDKYRTYREKVEDLFEQWTMAVSKAEGTDPVALTARKRDEYKSDLAHRLQAWNRDIRDRLETEKARVASWLKVDAGRYEETTAGVLVDLAKSQVLLPTALSRLEAEQEHLRQEFTGKYEAYLRALDRLVEGVDIEGVLRWSSDEIDVLKRRVSQIHSLAQLGVTVEIVGHEFETLDAEVRRGLSRLPRDAQATSAFQLVKQSHLSLVQKLRFLSPLKLSGMRLREKIRGKDIAKYMRDFFRDRLTVTRTDLSASETFDSAIVTDFRSRIYPVFINLLNNALYWLTFAKHERRILLDCVGDVVIVADSGNGVDSDDVSHLFELFFSRRVDGRGVGLYLCRENLGAGGHSIEYAHAPEHRLLSGANFVIRFRGLEHG